MTGGKWFRAAGLAAVVLVGTTAGAADPFTAMGAPRLASPYQAPGFTLSSTDGGKLVLESFRGKAVLLYFGASW